LNTENAETSPVSVPGKATTVFVDDDFFRSFEEGFYAAFEFHLKGSQGFCCALH
jgi:hypothetical protein